MNEARVDTLNNNANKLNALVGNCLSGMKNQRHLNNLGNFVIPFLKSKVNQSVPKQIGTSYTEDVALIAAQQFLTSGLDKIAKEGDHDEHANYYPLLNTILKFRIVDQIRKTEKERELFISGNDPQAHGDGDEWTDEYDPDVSDSTRSYSIDDFSNGVTLEDQFIEAEKEAASYAKVDKLLSNIPVKSAEVIVLHVDDDLTFAEIGEMLDISESTAKSRFYRGKRKLLNLREAACG